MGGNETILLVEDEPTILEMTEMMLKELGYHVLIGPTPGKARELAGKHGGGIDLLITDVVMPEMNGRDLANEIVSLCPGIRVLFMSGYMSDVIVRHGVLDQGVNYIQKPFALKDLALKVREVLNEN